MKSVPARSLMKSARLGCLIMIGLAPWFAAGTAAEGQTKTADRLGQELRNAGFIVRFDRGAITSLRRENDLHETDYIHAGGRFGDLQVRWRADQDAWNSFTTRQIIESPAAPSSWSIAAEEIRHAARFIVSDGGPEVTSCFAFGAGGTLNWSITLSNRTAGPIEVGDLAIQCPMNTKYEWDRETTYHKRVIRHSFIGGHGSFLFWMRCDSTGPYLLMTPTQKTHLEYFDQGGALSGPGEQYTVYIHSAGQKEVLQQHGTNWRQANTSVRLAPSETQGSSVTYGFRFSWVRDYDEVRRSLVSEDLFDVRVVPGMTVPADLSAKVAIGSRSKRLKLQPEFPKQTKIRSLGKGPDGMRLFEVEFGRLGENLIKVSADDGRQTTLEFFSTEPVETLVRKRAAFLARCQHRDPTKWYNGLITDWNMRDRVLVSPDNLDKIPEGRRYAVTCDDPGLCKAPFIAAKNQEYPEPKEIEALEYYIQHFIWGGLQMTDKESHPYALYGIQDWKRNRESTDPGSKGRLHIWRIYDYPHVVMLYLHMYRIGRDYPQIRMQLSAEEYLRRAHGTAMGLFKYPMEIVQWSPYETGLYNELVIEDVIDELERAGQGERASELRQHWHRKIEFFVSGKANLFASEYPFDTTGFEATHAFARYVLRGTKEALPSVSREQALRFAQQQTSLNIGCRGWLEPAYYHMGSDYRGSGNGRYTLSYMSQMGGWSLLDYALHDAADPHRYLPLAYASILSSWALMNSGTAESGYGYWYPGAENDGGAGGGFEPAPYGKTWLGQPHSRGSWYYGCEIDLGFGGGLRAAATVFANDPVFGPVAYGGLLKRKGDSWQVWCRDGVRRRFHIVDGEHKVQIGLSRDHFSGEKPVVFSTQIDTVSFEVEASSPREHSTELRLAGLAPGGYECVVDGKPIRQFAFKQGEESLMQLNISKPRHVVNIRRIPTQTK